MGKNMKHDYNIKFIVYPSFKKSLNEQESKIKNI